MRPSLFAATANRHSYLILISLCFALLTTCMHACIRPVLSIKQDVINPTQIGSTEVWGDGNAANGCAPPLRNTASCTDGADYLTAGTVIILEDDVPLPRDTSTLLWDGGDRIQSSFPVAITRGVYSGGEPGSLLGGAVEVLNTDSWGSNFESPVGVGMVDDIENNVGPGQGLNSFQLTEFHVMAAEDGTIVDLPGGPFTVTFDDGSEQIVTNTDPAVSTTFQLNMGETLRISGSLVLKADGKRGGGVDGGIKVGDVMLLAVVSLCRSHLSVVTRSRRMSYVGTVFCLRHSGQANITHRWETIALASISTTRPTQRPSLLASIMSLVLPLIPSSFLRELMVCMRFQPRVPATDFTRRPGSHSMA